MTLAPRRAELMLRPAEERDAEAIQRVAREAWEKTAQGVLGTADRAELVGHLYERRSLLEDIAHHRSLFLVATLEDAVVGFAEFVFEGRAGEVARVAVRPDWQRRGVASALLRRGLAAFAEAEVEVVTAAVEPQDEACRLLFERHGFESAGGPLEDLEGVGIELAEYRRRLDGGAGPSEPAAEATVWVDDSRRTCPRCHGHFQEPVESCPRCGAPLIAEAPRRREARTEWAPHFATLVASSDESRLAFVQAALESAGIRFSVHRCGTEADEEVVEVQVAGGQVEEARQLLDALEAEGVETGAGGD
jgi:ribosomal protein S18 acetylase RimI-like enzyme